MAEFSAIRPYWATSAKRLSECLAELARMLAGAGHGVFSQTLLVECGQTLASTGQTWPTSPQISAPGADVERVDTNLFLSSAARRAEKIGAPGTTSGIRADGPAAATTRARAR